MKQFRTSMTRDRKRCGWHSVVRAKGDFGLQMNYAGLEIFPHFPTMAAVRVGGSTNNNDVVDVFLLT